MSVALNVSRETMDRLETYAELLRKWNPKINLVSKSTIDDLWSRHIMDSAQIYSLAPHTVGHWADLGSGGGFPGLVIAIMAADQNSPQKTTLVESDARKCAFLRTVIRETEANAVVLNERIETLPSLAADILSARALGSLELLLSFADRHLAKTGTAIFPKGASWEKELADAQSKWKFDYQLVKSETESGPVIMKITGVSRV
ncbi:Ribosomal RNA small subunit methyltransferase G [Roseovarius gaetbuli]|uniref:Ribosomal RNA small subunit methyltransferase G n=1 Tax=Roseovarius gaetbuli TaxID=1356575 RepID=A0A1X6YWM8_9RHOB|nr:16S rRNA (guanine(527)-N(7))-methyltransferase RsmG [Roseovarius gaetbuli]SLN33344.1 Ribosomal RNA small subunit methyltransferase G [Roseovarius gaetbuli]